MDGKHSVFGKITDGLELLDTLEKMETVGNDRPKKDIVIEEIIVLENPYRDAIAEILLKDWKQKHEKKRLEDDKN